MNDKLAMFIFININDKDFTDEEKVMAIYRVLQMPTQIALQNLICSKLLIGFGIVLMRLKKILLKWQVMRNERIKTLSVLRRRTIHFT